VKLLFDAYHQLLMGEDIEAELTGSIDLVGHVQIADIPGRHEIGSGSIDWVEQLAALDRLGYRGAYGVEYRPTGDTVQSLVQIEEIAALGA
jgi:hydroxypyruvate isomerase